MKKIISLLMFNVVIFFMTTLSYSQVGTGQESDSGTSFLALLLIIIVTLVVLFVIIKLLAVKKKKTEAEEKKIKAKQEKIEQDIQEKLLNHDSDGIKELDNPPPAWYMYLFYATIIFAIIYMINYHTLGKSNLQSDEYAEDMMIAQQQREELIKTGAFIDENSVEASTLEEDINEGKNIFTVNCVSCHGNKGEGIVGPNLTDEYWIHGGGIVNVFKTVKHGVPEKGMISWQKQLSPKQIQQVASYVLTFAGTNPPNGKEPQGEIYKGEEVETDSLEIEETEGTETESLDTESEDDKTNTTDEEENK